MVRAGEPQKLTIKFVKGGKKMTGKEKRVNMIEAAKYEKARKAVMKVLGKAETQKTNPLFALFTAELDDNMDELVANKIFGAGGRQYGFHKYYKDNKKIELPNCDEILDDIRDLEKVTSYEEMRRLWPLGKNPNKTDDPVEMDPYIAAGVLNYFAHKCEGEKRLPTALDERLNMFLVARKIIKSMSDRETGTMRDFEGLPRDVQALLENAWWNYYEDFCSSYKVGGKDIDRIRIDKLEEKPKGWMPGETQSGKSPRKYFALYLFALWLQEFGKKHMKSKKKELFRAHTNLINLVTEHLQETESANKLSELYQWLREGGEELDKLTAYSQELEDKLKEVGGLRNVADKTFAKIESTIFVSERENFRLANLKRFVHRHAYNIDAKLKPDEEKVVESYAKALKHFLVNTFMPWREFLATMKLYVMMVDKFAFYLNENK